MAPKEFPLSIATDFKGGKGVPHKRLYQIAQAGFTHILWCHEMGKSDYFYSQEEITQSKKNLQKTGLALMDLHAPDGKMLNWTSLDESIRYGGIQLMRNRLQMTADLGGQVVMAHWRAEPMNNPNPRQASSYWDTTRHSLDELAKISRETGVRLALENLYSADNFPYLKSLLEVYPPDFLGFCYDSGHGNITGLGLEQFETMSERVISLHLSDNSGLNKRFPHHSDTHRLPFDGTVDWNKFTALLAKSTYQGPLNLELIKRTYSKYSDSEYLLEAFKRGQQLTHMVRNQANNELALA